MPTLDDLNQAFALPGALVFEEQHNLPCARITLPTCTATVFLHGAHLAHWQPAGTAPVLYLSPQSLYQPDKAIRGGIPICFPWFADRQPADRQLADRQPADRHDGPPSPAHGFARLEDWSVAFAALAGDFLHLTLTLGPTDRSRALGYPTFQAVAEFTFGATLQLRFTTANTGNQSMSIEEALHSYFAIGDIHRTTLTGLEQAPYIDKNRALARDQAPATPLPITGPTDCVFPNTTATVTLHDQANRRRIVVSKSGSATTVVWNPWQEATAKLADLPPDSWQHFLCVETANAGENALTLAPGEAHTLILNLSVEPADPEPSPA